MDVAAGNFLIFVLGWLLGVFPFQLLARRRRRQLAQVVAERDRLLGERSQCVPRTEMENHLAEAGAETMKLRSELASQAADSEQRQQALISEANALLSHSLDQL